MKGLTAFARTVTTINVWVARIFNWVVVVLFALLLWDAIMRYVVGSPIEWSQQLSRLLFGVYLIIGGGYLLARGGHVNVDLVYGTMTRRGKAWMDVATSFLFFLLVVVLVWSSALMFYEKTCELGTSSIPWCKWEVDDNAIWHAPLWPSKGMIVIAAVLLLLQGIVKLMADILVLCGVEVDETAFGPIDEDHTGRDQL